MTQKFQKSQEHKQEQEIICGTVERITFYSAETGFTVFSLKQKRTQDPIIIVGKALVNVGESVNASGIWINDARYGPQFKASEIRTELPQTLVGIHKYLASGVVKGIGPHLAERIVKKFGIDTLKIIESSPDKLLDIDGIGNNKLQSIIECWRSNSKLRDIMIFLGTYGITTSLAHKIYRRYGDDTIMIVQKNPYQMIYDIVGVGFLSADKIAINVGIEKNSPMRIAAAVNFVLIEAISDGCCGLPITNVIEKATDILGDVRTNLLIDAINHNLNNGNMIAAIHNEMNESPGYQVTPDIPIATDSGDVTQLDANIVLHLLLYWNIEKSIANNLLRIKGNGQSVFANIDIDEALKWLEEAYKRKLSSSQYDAIHLIARSKLSIITGGPGTGKTTLISSILNILRKAFEGQNLVVKLAAPTGRAAKRMSESTKSFASTIHRLLEVDNNTGKFKHNEVNQLICDVLIIDETSMLDVKLMLSLLRSISSHTTVIFVGDVDQIPSVGPGYVLADMINSNVIGVVRLSKVFRQAANSNIIMGAHLVNRGMMPSMKTCAFDNVLDDTATMRKSYGLSYLHDESNNNDKPNSNYNSNNKNDFLFIDADQWGKDNLLDVFARFLSNKLYDLINNVVKDEMCNEDSLSNILQVLSPMQKGQFGTKSLNILLQKYLNPRIVTSPVIDDRNIANDNINHGVIFIERMGIKYYVGDKVMQIENNYDKNVFNGDIGFIKEVNAVMSEIIVDFDGYVVLYSKHEIEQLVLAYAITIHKAQGSEYQIVLMPLLSEHFIMLSRNLLYTAITRAKKLVILFGSSRAIAMAVKNDGAKNRYTMLRLFLKELGSNMKELGSHNIS